MNPADTLITALRQHNGHANSPDLQARLGVSQSTVSRLLAPLLASGQVVKVGAARAQRYLLPRDVPGVGRHVLIHQVHPGASCKPLARFIRWSVAAFGWKKPTRPMVKAPFTPACPGS